MAKKTITLSEPIELEGRDTITEVTVRTPKVREVRQLAALGETAEDQMDEAISAILLLTDLDAESVEELDTADMMALSEAIADFFPEGAGSGTGDQSSQSAPAS